MSQSWVRYFWGFLLGLLVVSAPRTSHAAGTVKLKSNEASEVSGAWHVFVTIQLPKPPSIPHQPMKFMFTKTAVFERSLVDGKSEPVTNKVALANQQPSMETLDVDFADSSGKIFNQTRFDFGLTRISLAEQNAAELESYRFESLEYLYGMAKRERLRWAA